MSKNIVVLNANLHGNLKCKKTSGWEGVAGQNMLPLVASEYMYAANNFPVVFVKDGQTGGVKSVGLIGLDDGENLVFTQECINSTYIPIDIQRYPFYMAGDAGVGDIKLCVDMEAPALNGVEGDALFTAEGKVSSFLEGVQVRMTDLLEKEAATRAFIEDLLSLELLQPAQLTITVAGEKQGINGIYKVDEEKLASLSDQDVIAVHRKGYLPAIYAHLNSLGQIQKLIRLKVES